MKAACRNKTIRWFKYSNLVKNQVKVDGVGGGLHLHHHQQEQHNHHHRLWHHPMGVGQRSGWSGVVIKLVLFFDQDRDLLVFISQAIRLQLGRTDWCSAVDRMDWIGVGWVGFDFGWEERVLV